MLKAVRFFILDNVIFWKDHSEIFLNYLLKEEVDEVLQECHAGECGGHLY